MITQERHLDKSELVDQMAELQQFVHDAARDGTAAHEVEHGLFRRLLSLGHDLLSKFFSLQGSGDIGQQLTLPDGEVLPRQPELHDRPYTTIFGDFTLSRTVYSAGANQQLVALSMPGCNSPTVNSAICCNRGISWWPPINLTARSRASSKPSSSCGNIPTAWSA